MSVFAALGYHFETMPLPSPLSWYSYHLPEQFLKLVVVFVNVLEMGMPFLFFVPIRGLRQLCFCFQVINLIINLNCFRTKFFFQIFLQICIVLTGNWDFSNILMVILLLSLLNDHFFYSSSSSKKSSVVVKLLTFVITVAFAYGVSLLYSFKRNDQEIQVSFGKI